MDRRAKDPPLFESRLLLLAVTSCRRHPSLCSPPLMILSVRFSHYTSMGIENEDTTSKEFNEEWGEIRFILAWIKVGVSNNEGHHSENLKALLSYRHP